MKNTLKTLTSVLLLTTSLSARENPQRHTLSLGLEGQKYTYNETVDGKKFMELKSMMGGINASYRFQPNILFLSPEIRYLRGKENYQSEDSGKLSGIPSHLFEGRVLIGLDVYSVNRLKFSPYTGIGYRYKQDDSHLKKTDLGCDGYKRENHAFYIPVGMEVSYAFNEKSSFSLKGEYDSLIRGTQHSHMGILGTEKLTHKQTSGYGFKTEAMISLKMTSCHVSFGPYLHYWKIKDSEKKDDSLEPQNKTIEPGLKIKWTF